MFLLSLFVLLVVLVSATVAFDTSLCGSAGSGVCSTAPVIRKPLVAGNWKMNTDLSTAHSLTTEVVSLTTDLKFDDIEIALFPPFPFIHTVKKVWVRVGFSCILLVHQSL